MRTRIFALIILLALLAPIGVSALTPGELAAKNEANRNNSRFLKCGFDLNGDGSVKGPGEECGFSDIILTITNIITYLIILGASVATISFAYAGFLMMTSGGASEQINHAKSIFSKVVFGFIIMLAAWLIVKTIEVTLVDTSNIPSYLTNP